VEIFTSQGRASRQEYLLHLIAGSLLFAVFLILATWLLADPGAAPWARSIIAILYFVTVLAVFLDEVGVTVRRLRDLGRPRSHLWLLLVPIYNVYLELVLLLRPGIRASEHGDLPGSQSSTLSQSDRPPGEYLCGRCGAQIEWGVPTCPSCGDTIEY
jgi:uncharacterized membrane protein YhaH (DUF805 family)